MPKRDTEIALGIVRHDDAVLMVERAKKEQGMGDEVLSWVFPGGKIEVGETSLQAAEREVREEAGEDVEAIGSLDTVDNSAFNVRIHYIACRLASRDSNVDVDDSAVVRKEWVPIAMLADYVTSSLNPKVVDYLNLP